MPRDVYRVDSIVDTNDMDTTLTNLGTLHNADVSKTLVRTIIDGYFYQNTTAGVSRALIAIVLVPEDFTATPILDHVEALDNDVADEFIFKHAVILPATYNGTNGANTTMVPLFRDIKSMRKMDRGDEIKLYGLSALTEGIGFYGIITQFFKDA